ncbi:MAG: hypothetical protein DVB31_12600 [Verrucomicrobia bacterium]|nr:MAG: hypothetical protein DVB31_12600 [Verrucomicrobiota bacterium]
MTDAERSDSIRTAMPSGGLFAGQTWRVSPRPLALPAAFIGELEFLGRVLLQFYRATSLLYRRSLEGKAPEWVAALLDQGKPAGLIAWQRDAAYRNEVPRVIRPDVLLTDGGFVISELDSVPGGIGATDWLNATYAALGDPVVGGADGMRDGFAGIFGDAANVHLVVSEEAAAYRPEMEWMASRLGGRFAVRDGTHAAFADGDAVYRFFELFDVANVPAARAIFDAGAAKRVRVTPPPRPIFEEKLLLALAGNRNLRAFWRQELGEGFLQRLLKVLPQSWVVDPQPLPPHAAYPGLDLTDWRQLKALSQRERDLILKISGFSPNAWGARGVHLGSDLSAEEWSVAVDAALAAWPDSPHVLQRYHKPRVVPASWFDFDARQTVPMPGRVRLCPYYFVVGDGAQARPRLGGVLATICPADKKIIHGMTDAILAPVMAEPTP